ncbi:LysR family transcriptional regulator [Stenotrophomonas rhizophila]|uniref:LysR family transcriptional regulator n=1 Tax=Stenotrophomonas rhizophila TaxID=216778 RepID=UPI001E29AC37|nr:LysR family transcriptional regulator [Stenotrophomonas rhizophila]MCC7633638.1 LysR family transcriptional regulator [Stenotrophomonas rhizophila]MCC7663584.1 LysR family transcriptional regulator [Stenotrophomonas rhizophila]
MKPDLQLPRVGDGHDALNASFSTSYAGVLAFIAVAAEGSFARAGDRLGIGRSAVSRSVQKLENQLGVRLFLRTTRSTSLTGEGRMFLEGCSPGVDRILQALEQMRELRDGPPRGHLRIGASYGFGRRVIAPLLAAFRSEYPEVSVELLLDEQAPDLSAGRIDVAFRDGVLDDSQVIAKQLVPMQVLVCASPGYAQRHGLPATVEELSGHACIGHRLAGGRLQRWEFRVDGSEVHPQPDTALVFNDAELALQAVIDGLGIAQLPSYQVREALRAGTVLTCLDSYSPQDRGHYLCYLSRRQLPKRIRAFIDFSTQRVRALELDAVAHRGPCHRPVARDATVQPAWA